MFNFKAHTVVKQLLPKIYLAVIYIVISLAVGEWHPFSKYPMYSTFPNSALVVMAVDSAQNVLPLTKYLRIGSADLTHNLHAAKARFSQAAQETASDSTWVTFCNNLPQWQFNKAPAGSKIVLRTLKARNGLIEINDTTLCMLP